MLHTISQNKGGTGHSDASNSPKAPSSKSSSKKAQTKKTSFQLATPSKIVSNSDDEDDFAGDFDADGSNVYFTILNFVLSDFFSDPEYVADPIQGNLLCVNFCIHICSGDTTLSIADNRSAMSADVKSDDSPHLHMDASNPQPQSEHQYPVNAVQCSVFANILEMSN
jgi:hypothetical protein